MIGPLLLFLCIIAWSILQGEVKSKDAILLWPAIIFFVITCCIFATWLWIVT